jgi:hypothetical protein
MLADALTKPLMSERHKKLCNAVMGLHEKQGGVLNNNV